jgi:hypothetical protein
VAPLVSGDTATYQGILPGTDLALAPTATGSKESIVLRSAGYGEFVGVPVEAHGSDPAASVGRVGESGRRVGDGGGADPAGLRVRFEGRPGVGGAGDTYAVGFALTTVDGAPALRVTLDAGWLADPARVFPVTVDPTFTEVSSSTYAEVSAPVGDHSMEKTIKIGSYNSGPDSANSFLLFPKDLDNSGVQVSSASLRLFDTWASTCTASRPDVAPVTQSWTPPG